MWKNSHGADIKALSVGLYWKFLYCYTGFEALPRGNYTTDRDRQNLRGKIGSKIAFNPLSANPTKWSNTLKQIRQQLCLTILWYWSLKD